MFKRVIICFDLSPASEIICHCASDLKGFGLEEAILVHVIYVANTPGLEDGLISDARPIVEMQRSLLEAKGIKTSIEMPIGIPASSICEIADRYNASTILIGSHGKRIARSLALGSTSTHLLHITERPVLLIGRNFLEDSEGCKRGCKNLLTHILFPTDFSNTSERAFGYLEKVIERWKSCVTLLHVHKKGVKEEEASLNIARLRRMRRHLEEKEASKVYIKEECDRTAETIVEQSREAGATLILMGTHGRGVVSEVIHGSVAHQVARMADIPILFIPPIH